jgi:hypothetical protein
MRKLFGSLVIACMAAGVAHAADDRWIHVRVDDADDGKGQVDIQVPIGMVTSLLPMLKGKHGHGSIEIDGGDMDLAELRRYWAAVRTAKDGEYVTVRDADSNVKIGKSGGYFRLTVDEAGDRSRVRMKVPVQLIDALLTGSDDVDLDAVGTALAKVPSGEILTVDDDESHVRIWIDDNPAPAREDRP